MLYYYKNNMIYYRCYNKNIVLFTCHGSIKLTMEGRGDQMSTNTLILIIVLFAVFGGFGYTRWRR